MRKCIINCSMLALSCATLFTASLTHAFKPKTHVWIAQQVIDDLKDGRVEFRVKGVTQSYPVDKAVASAILNNQSVYRMGHIGPDAAPDIYAGQMVIHPGTVTFGTDQWAIALNDYVNDLNKQYTDAQWYSWKDSICESRSYSLDEVWSYLNKLSEDDSSTSGSYLTAANEIGLLDAFAAAIHDPTITGKKAASKANPAHIAYEKGFYGHVAGDTFAHSYVNHYAGDVFSLTNGEMETEKRHAAIEVYIDHKLPKLPQGVEHKLIDSPSEFIARAFILNDDVAGYFGTHKSKVTGKMRSAGAEHLYAMAQMRKAVRNAASSCIWTAIDRFAMQIAVASVTGYQPNEKQIAALNRLQDTVHGMTGDVKDGITSVQKELNSVIKRVDRARFDRLDQKMRDFESGVNRINSLEQKILDAERRITEEIVGTLCEWEEKRSCGLSLSCRLADEVGIGGPACSSLSVYREAVRLRDRAIAERDRQVGSILSSMRQDLENLETVVMEIHELMDVVHETVNKIGTFSDDISPFRQALRRWDEQIVAAIVAWVEANSEVIRLSMVRATQAPNTSERTCYRLGGDISDCFASDDTLQPIQDWMEVHGPVFQGIPVEVGRLGTQSRAVVDSVSDLIGGRARSQLLNIQSPVSRMGLLDLEEKISRELSGVDPIEELLDVTGHSQWLEQYHDIREVFALRMDKTVINNLFAEDRENLGLITHTKFTDLMDRDMGIAPGSSGKITLSKFPAMDNAVTLAKLSLLGPEQLTQVGKDLGMPNTTKYGSRLYPTPYCSNHPIFESGSDGTLSVIGSYEQCGNQHASNKNVLFHAIRNIDGHEAWRPKSDRLPREGQSFNNAFAMEDDDREFPPLQYGYPREGKQSGFRFWQQGEIYFNRLFKMPLFDNAAPTPSGAKCEWQNYTGNSAGLNRVVRVARPVGPCIHSTREMYYTSGVLDETVYR